MIARLLTGLHFEARFAGLVLNIIESTASGPSELAAFTVDGVELGKPSGTPRVFLSVWHYQVKPGRETFFVYRRRLNYGKEPFYRLVLLVYDPIRVIPFHVCTPYIQLDDMRPDSPHPVILTPLASGFNSHLNKDSEGNISPIPAIQVGGYNAFSSSFCLFFPCMT